MRPLDRSGLARSGAIGAIFLIVAGCSPGDSDAPAVAPAERPGPEASIDAQAMEDALARALANPDSLDRIDAVAGLMRKLDATNLPGAIEAYDAAAGGLDRDEVKLFANAWARIDSRAALEHFTRFRAPQIGQSAISEVINYWTRHGGAEDAREFALASLGMGRSDGQTLRNTVVDATVQGLAGARQHEALTEMLAGFPADENRSWLITQALLEQYRSGPDEVRGWVDSIPWDAPNDLKLDALRGGIGSLAKADGAAAASWYESVEERLPPGSFLELIAEGWAPAEPLAAIEWLQKRPESEPRLLALRTAAYAYLKADGKAASEWITARLADPAIDAAMRFPLTNYMMTVDLQAALKLAERIPAQGEKIGSLKQILGIWGKTDQAAVDRYMAEQGVPIEVERAVRGMKAFREQRQRATAANGGKGS